MKKRIVIIGGVAGGASAAARARRLSEEAEIIILERGPYISFANCGLPYFISGEIKQESALLLQTPESFYARFNVDVRVLHEVIAIHRELKGVEVKNHKTGEVYLIAYDQLILSPGAEPAKKTIQGSDNPYTYTLRTIDDMKAIIQGVTSNDVKHVVVCGAGFIGLEALEALHHHAFKLTLLAPQVMPSIDKEMSSYLVTEFKEKGIELLLPEKLAKIEYNKTLQAPLTLTCISGKTLTCDRLILASGMNPEVSLAKQAGLTLGPRGSIQVNTQMQTNDSDIYAVGDAIEVEEWVTGDSIRSSFAGPANRQGRIAADTIFGRDSHYQRSQNTAICRIFSQTAASVGLTETELCHQNIPYEKVYLHAVDHANYYPGAEMIHLKLLFEPTNGMILGAQAVGKAGIDKRIDVLAVAQRANMTVFDLQHVELCYSPPYGSARDIINLAGFVASNVINGDHEIVHANQLPSLKEAILVDVRTEAEFTQGALPGAINIPVDSLRKRWKELPEGKLIIVYCRVGLRGYIAYRILSQLGLCVKNLSGGFLTWKSQQNTTQ